MALPDPAVSATGQPSPLIDWHARTPDEVARYLNVAPLEGLALEAVSERQLRHGLNLLPTAVATPPWRRLLAQFSAPLVLVLIASGAVTALLGERLDASVIFAVVLVNAMIGYWQESRAEGALAALARTVSTPACVRRAGGRSLVDASQLVPGDIVLLSAGDRVPADMRLIDQHELRTNESALTGESLPLDKHIQVLPPDTPLAERLNMVYAGTSVLAGQACGIVVATGMQTQTGRIARLLSSTQALETPLTRKMARFSNGLLWMISGLALLTFVVGVLRGESIFAMFMAAVALAVGAIPEGLPAAVTVTLAIGVNRMARRRAIIRRLPAVETLGGTTVICSDKTGTLTENAMTVRLLACGGQTYRIDGQAYEPLGSIYGPQEVVLSAVPAGLDACLRAASLCNDASLYCADGQWQITGDPTEAALLVLAHKAGLDARHLRQAFPRLDEWPFDASRQFMATLHAHEGGGCLYLKGAPERLLPACRDQVDASGAVVALDSAWLQAQAHAFARQGLRVLLLARSQQALPNLPTTEALPALTVLGLVGMIDPPRPAAIAAVRACQQAGIRIKMITGDHALTAQAIAGQIGLAAGQVLSGQDLAALSDAQLREVVVGVDVFARVEPEQKLRLVRALQARGEVVAMTGDGVNDAPALRQADIGIAMGLGGTEVAKEAAAMVLTDDNFSSIEAAVEEGRGVWDNLVKFIAWTLPTNFGEGLVIVAAILFGTTLPITPLQILWINMTTAVLLGLPLAFEPIEAGVMQRSPRRLDAALLDRALLWRIVLVSALLLAAAFGLFMREIGQGHPLAEARTVAVNLFVLVQMFYLFNCRSFSRSFWELGLFSNPWIWLGLVCMMSLQLAFTYLPTMNLLFQTAPISFGQWLEILLVALLCSGVVGLEKLWRQRRGAV